MCGESVQGFMDKIFQCDVTQGIPLSDKSVHCVITSPPYWGLRDYGVPDQLGLEKTPAEYIEKMVAVFREVWRVLRDDGTCWLNMGDSYASGKGTCYNPGGGVESLGKARKETGAHPLDRGNISTLRESGLKPKDLCMMPHRLAMALQADGWWIRSDIVWAKPNPMPESVTDRPTKSHEYIFLCTKRAKYFYDAEAIKEPQSETSHPRYAKDAETPPAAKPDSKELARPGYENWRETTPVHMLPNGRNKRSVWTIPAQSYSEAHFATFPEKLVEPCIKAGTSEKGCCAECGSPWVRMVEKSGGTTGESWHDHKDDTGAGMTQTKDGVPLNTFKNRKEKENPYKVEMIGWKPTCNHGGDPVPAVVYDPFMGSGTVGLVAYKNNRNYIGTELNQEYIDMAERRIGKEKDNYRLFNESI